MTLGPNEYRASLVTFGDRTRAGQFLDRLKSGGAFSAFSGTDGHKSGWLSFPLPPAAGHSGGLPPSVAEALLRLRPGMVAAEPVAHEGTWYVIRLDTVRATAVPEYAQARTHIRQMLERREAERAAAAFVAGLLRRAPAEP